MKRFQSLLAVTTLALLLGCEDTSNTTPDETSSAETATTGSESTMPAPEPAESEPDAEDESATSDKTTPLDSVKKKVGETTEATRDFTASEMKDYKEKLNTKLADFDEQLDQWKAKGKELGGEAEKEWQAQLEAMNEKRSKLQSELERLGEASGDAWQDLKAGIDDAWTDLKAAADKASQNFDES